MSDMFGYVMERPEFRDIRDQRPSSAEEKAELCVVLNALLKRTPSPERISSVQEVRSFKASHTSALKILQGKSSTRPQLQSAINTMRAWTEGPEA